jgi:PadR family transcriptional regulator PadR
MRQELPKGDLPTLILAVLATAPMHGYAIAREVERLSEQVLRTREGSLYPALRVLEQDGLIVGTWEPQEKGAARKVYALTEKGQREMAKRTRELLDYARLINVMLGRMGHAPSA